jgi:hypothetical protein
VRARRGATTSRGATTMNEFRVGSMCVGVCVGLLYTPSGGLCPHPRNSGAAPRNSQIFSKCRKTLSNPSN